MKKLFFLLLPLLAAAWLASLGGCDKDPKTTITVQEFGTHTPIANARVSLGNCDDGYCYEVGSGTTNAEGKFSTGQDAFTAGATADGFWDTGDDVIFIGSISGVSQIRNLIYLYPHAWLEVTVKNESGAYEITVPGDWPIGLRKHVHLSKGQQETFTILSRGGTDFNYIFSIQDTPGQFRTDFSNVQVESESGEVITVNQTPANWFLLYLNGHETAKITITY